MKRLTPDEIAAHTMATIRVLRAAQDVNSVRQVAFAWRAWAADNGVAAQIREHVSIVEAEVARELQVRQKTTVRNSVGG